MCVWLRLGTGASELLECLDGLCSVLSVSGMRTSLLALLFFGPPLLLVPEWGVCGCGVVCCLPLCVVVCSPVPRFGLRLD